MGHWSRWGLAGVAFVGVALGSVSGEAHDCKKPGITASNAWAQPAAAASGMLEGYVTITNQGQSDDRLLKVTTGLTGSVQIDDSAGAAAPDSGGIVIPAGATVALAPAMPHISFVGVPDLPKEGQDFQGTLVFEKAGAIDVSFEVKPAGANVD